MTPFREKATEIAELICEHYTGASDDGNCERTIEWISEALQSVHEETVRQISDMAYNRALGSFGYEILKLLPKQDEGK